MPTEISGSTGVNKIQDGTIVNADINSSAAIDASKLTGVGLANADYWRLTTQFQSSATITSNLERVDTDSFNVLGTGMTESSGVFSFPQTGYYLINYMWTTENTGLDDCFLMLNVSTDGGANYGDAGRAYAGNRESSSTKNSASNTAIVDVTDTSNVVVKFSVHNANQNTYTMGSSNLTWTGFTFVRLGDT